MTFTQAKVLCVTIEEHKRNAELLDFINGLDECFISGKNLPGMFTECKLLNPRQRYLIARALDQENRDLESSVENS